VSLLFFVDSLSREKFELYPVSGDHNFECGTSVPLSHARLGALNSITYETLAPCHMFNSKGTYMVTAGTSYKEHFFKKPEHLDFLQSSLFQLADFYCWRLEAWAIFSNHYHFVAQSPENPPTLQKLIRHFHNNTSRELNKIEGMAGRKIWYQYWDSQLTFTNSYFARLNYVMNNPVKHHLVEDAEFYPWCSESWFAKNTNASHKEVVMSFKTDTVQVVDNF
jgi:putative transposase